MAHLERTLGAIDAMEAKFREMAETAERHFRATLDESFAALSSAPAAKLGEVCEVLDARRVPIKQADRKPGSVPYYGASGVQDYVADYLFDEPLVLLGEDGAKWGPGERSAYRITGKAWVNNHAHVLRPRAGMDSAYLTAYLNMKDLLPWISGVTVPKLTQARMKEIPLPLPPLAEQERVVARLERAEGVSRRVVALAQEGVAQCGVYRRAVLSEAFGVGGVGDE